MSRVKRALSQSLWDTTFVIAACKSMYKFIVFIGFYVFKFNIKQHNQVEFPRYSIELST